MSSAQLCNLLQLFQVPVESWNTAAAKSTDDLLLEITEGECYLRIDESGLARVVELAKLHISQALHANRGHLIEISECPPGRMPFKRNAHPSETLKRGETVRQAVVRGIQEELKVNESGIYSMYLKPPEIELRPSKAYPNLACMYVLHHTDVVLLNSVSICHQHKFETTEEDGTVHQWSWEHF